MILLSCLFDKLANSANMVGINYYINVITLYEQIHVMTMRGDY